MAATLKQLVRVRSQAAEALIDYLRRVEESLARNSLLERFDRNLDDLRVPLRVAPFEPVRDIESLYAREHFRFSGLIDEEDEDRKSRRAYASRGNLTDDERARPEPLDSLEPQLEMAVLLGDPGSGKTEWLKYLARRKAKEAREQIENFLSLPAEITFPVFLRLSDLADALEDADSLKATLVEKRCVCSTSFTITAEERVAAAILKCLVEKQELPERLAPLAWRKLSAKKADRGQAQYPALICLDAWDEAREGQERVKEFLEPYARATGAKVFLTSRIIGYTLRPLPIESGSTAKRELQICPFGWDETEKFVESFFGRDADRSHRMLDELKGKIAVAGMAQNPLLATLLCMAFSPHTQSAPIPFPARRCDVYDRVLEGLLDEWEATGKGRNSDRRLIRAKVRLLEEVAYRFFPDEEIDGDEMVDFIEDYVEGLPDTARLKKAAREGEDLAESLCHDGILVRSGAKHSESGKSSSYLFIHLTFEEYLYAGGLKKRLESGAKRGDGSMGSPEWKIVERKAWHPAWHEVIKMLAGRLDDPAPMIEALSASQPTENNPCGDDIFRHRLALAAMCLPEIRPEKRIANAERIDRITGEAFLLWREHNKKYTADAVSNLRQALSSLAQVNGKVEGLPLLDWILARLKSRSDLGETAEAVEGIGSAAARDDILDQLALLLRDKEWQVRQAAALAVVGIGSAAARDDILDQLALLLRDEKDYVRSFAAEAVEGIGSAAARDDILDQLALLLRDEDSDVRRDAARAVVGIGSAAARDDILDQLALLLRDEDLDVRRDAARAVVGIGSAAARDDILNQLALLLRDENYGVRRAAAAVFKRWHSQGLRIFKDTALKTCSIKELSRLEP
ncbi:MAG: HEAT repeat domain-containing protein [Acidobacteriota bacterium]